MKYLVGQCWATILCYTAGLTSGSSTPTSNFLWICCKWARMLVCTHIDCTLFNGIIQSFSLLFLFHINCNRRPRAYPRRRNNNNTKVIPIHCFFTSFYSFFIFSFKWMHIISKWVCWLCNATLTTYIVRVWHSLDQRTWTIPMKTSPVPDCLLVCLYVCT